MTVTYEELRSRVQGWTNPLPGASPTGESAKFDPAYQAVANEVAKLDMPSGGAVAWKMVVDKGGGLLAGKSKDLVMAAYVAHALHVTAGLAGLTDGCVLLVELMEQYWETLFPEVKRLRGRANAIQWFVEKTQLALASPGKGSLEELEALEAAAIKLADVSRARLMELAPAFGAILEVVGRLRSEATPPPAPEPVAASAAPSGSGGGGSDTSGSSGSAAAPAATLAAVDGPADPNDYPGYLRGVGTALVAAAHGLRGADPKDPTAYRVLRTATWLGLLEEPPSEDGRTPIPPPSTRDQLKELLGGQQWAELVEAAETTAAEDTIWLDPHRMTWQALGGLGPAYKPAQQAVVAEVRTLIGRLPGLARLTFSDGSACADPATVAWLEEEVGKPSGGGRGSGGGLGEAAMARLGEAREQVSAGGVAEGLGAAREAIAAAGSERERFLVRLEIARLSVAAGLNALALATFQELDRQAQELGLDDWEPALSAECLRGIISVGRQLAEDPRGVSLDLVSAHRRLSRLDPAAAHDLWP